MKTVGNSSRGRSQGVPKIFRAPMYMAHCAVIFAIAQLSCIICASESTMAFSLSDHFKGRRVDRKSLRAQLRQISSIRGLPIKLCTSVTVFLREMLLVCYVFCLISAPNYESIIFCR